MGPLEGVSTDGSRVSLLRLWVVPYGGWPSLLMWLTEKRKAGAPSLRFCKGGYDAAKGVRFECEPRAAVFQVSSELKIIPDLCFDYSGLPHFVVPILAN